MRIKFPFLAIFLSSVVATSLGACGSDSGSSSCNNNNMVDPGEKCDGLDLQGQTCATLLMMNNATGTPSCKNCEFDTTMCKTGAGGASGTGGGTGTGGGI